MKEQWKDVTGYEGIYQISNMGRVLSLERFDKRGHRRKSKLLKQTTNARGYKYVVFQDNKSKVVHKLVAQEFIENPDNKPYPNHINGVKTDNRAKNLEWVTHSENILHACRTGLRNTPKGEDNYNAALTNKQVKDIRLEYLKGNTTYEKLAKKYNVSLTIISNVVKNKTYIEAGGN